MVRLNALTAAAVLSFASAVYGAPTPDEVNLPQPEDFKTQLGYDPDYDVAVRGTRRVASNKKISEIIPEIITVNVADIPQSNATEFPASIIGPAEPESAKRAILGNDDRVLWTNRDYPYRAMGRISLSNGVFCSGALIGSRHVATARHCIPGEGVSARFQPAYDNGEVLGGYDVSVVFHATYGQTGWCANGYDWAIFVLAEKAGTANGWLGLKTVNPDTQLNKPLFFHYGYPGDKGGSRPYRQESITATAATGCDRGSPVVTDTDSAGGQSGGPVWIYEDGSRYLYAIHVGSTDTFSVAAGGPSLFDGFGILLKDYPY
ncbi:glutamyl endopeptidase [Colletotrichum karsti]|uniref:Serine protease n=1 Tax=Colletotrichum karsti TaxID=1095194 RepID=A0A9P6HU04_9PEZI|nr:glutamyl endopeptidase [Colletotrichum karsti]KAF9869722.1 glutamyl endopeptidase [Colletotrichum karsti]